MFSDTFAGISPLSVPGFVVFQPVGAAVALLAIRALYPHFTDAAARCGRAPGDTLMTTSTLPRALFVCVHNAGRSQMAQAFWEQLGGEARSAGSQPAEQVHPEVITVMREVGVDLSGRVPRALDDADAEWAEVVVTMGCGDACPFIPGKRYLDWELEDPAGRDIGTVRVVRDEILRRVTELAGRGDQLVR